MDKERSPKVIGSFARLLGLKTTAQSQSLVCDIIGDGNEQVQQFQFEYNGVRLQMIYLNDTEHYLRQFFGEVVLVTGASEIAITRTGMTCVNVSSDGSEVWSSGLGSDIQARYDAQNVQNAVMKRYLSPSNLAAMDVVLARSLLSKLLASSPSLQDSISTPFCCLCDRDGSMYTIGVNIIPRAPDSDVSKRAAPRLSTFIVEERASSELSWSGDLHIDALYDIWGRTSSVCDVDDDDDDDDQPYVLSDTPGAWIRSVWNSAEVQRLSAPVSNVSTTTLMVRAVPGHAESPTLAWHKSLQYSQNTLSNGYVALDVDDGLLKNVMTKLKSLDLSCVRPELTTLPEAVVEKHVKIDINKRDIWLHVGCISDMVDIFIDAESKGSMSWMKSSPPPLIHVYQDGATVVTVSPITVIAPLAIGVQDVIHPSEISDLISDLKLSSRDIDIRSLYSVMRRNDLDFCDRLFLYLSYGQSAADQQASASIIFREILARRLVPDVSADNTTSLARILRSFVKSESPDSGTVAAKELENVLDLLPRHIAELGSYMLHRDLVTWFTRVGLPVLSSETSGMPLERVLCLTDLCHTLIDVMTMTISTREFGEHDCHRCTHVLTWVSNELILSSQIETPRPDSYPRPLPSDMMRGVIWPAAVRACQYYKSAPMSNISAIISHGIDKEVPMFCVTLPSLSSSTINICERISSLHPVYWRVNRSVDGNAASSDVYVLPRDPQLISTSSSRVTVDHDVQYLCFVMTCSRSNW